MRSNFKANLNAFAESHKDSAPPFGFEISTLSRLEPFLSFLYNDWWRVSIQGADRIPSEGPALLVGNGGGAIEWPALMLIYALFSQLEYPRRINIVTELGWISNPRLKKFLTQVGFVPWSADNIKRLFAAGELVAIFPESARGQVRPFGERYRLTDFDWTMIFPAIEEKVRIYPLSTLGCDEATPVVANLEKMASFLELPSFPVTPFFPWLPFPLNLMSLPVRWRMTVLKSVEYQTDGEREGNQDEAKRLARLTQGEIQAELNREIRQHRKLPL